MRTQKVKNQYRAAISIDDEILDDDSWEDDVNIYLNVVTLVNTIVKEAG